MTNELVIRELAADEEVRAAFAIESRCYPPEQAATLEAFRYRQLTYPSFFVGAWEGDQLLGIACGVRTNAADCSDGGIKKRHGGAVEGRKLCVLSVATDPALRGRGIGTRLLGELVARASAAGLEEAMLMCQSHLVGWYRDRGFAETGLVHDEHGGVEWHDMLRKL